MSPLARSRLVAALLLAAMLAPVAWAIFVNHGKGVRWWGGGTLAGIWAIQFLRDRVAVGRGPRGDAAQGLTLFVEPLAWLSIKWGFRRFLLAAEILKLSGRIEFFGWSGGWRGWTLLPELVCRKRNLGHAARLAERLTEHARAHPGSPIRMVAYSSGCFVALEAVARLPQDVRVEKLVLLAPTVAPDCDLAAATTRSGKIVCVCSMGDFLINGLATVALGTNDRRHALSAGMVGFSRRDGSADESLRQVRWRPAMVRRGWFGGHFTVSSVAMLTDLLRSV